MTTPSGTIELSDVNVELSYTSTTEISMDNSEVRRLASVLSGQIAMSDLQSKTDIYPNVNWISSQPTVQIWQLSNSQLTKFTGTITLSFDINEDFSDGASVVHSVWKNSVNLGALPTVNVVSGDFLYISVGVLGGPVGSQWTGSATITNDTAGGVVMFTEDFTLFKS